MNLKELLTEDEDVRLRVYDDKTGRPLKPGDTLQGHPTIGVGRALDVNGISPAEASILLDNDIAKVTKLAVANLPWFQKLTENRQNVILSMIFNMGLEGFLEFKDMNESLKFGLYPEAAAEMLDSKWARDQVRERAHRLSQMMRDG